MLQRRLRLGGCTTMKNGPTAAWAISPPGAPGSKPRRQRNRAVDGPAPRGAGRVKKPPKKPIFLNDLREESLTEIWTKEGNFAYNRNFEVSMLTGACAGCDKGSICRGGCRGSSYFSSGSLFESRYCNYPGRRPLIPPH